MISFLFTFDALLILFCHCFIFAGRSFFSLQEYCDDEHSETSRMFEKDQDLSLFLFLERPSDFVKPRKTKDDSIQNVKKDKSQGATC